MAQKTPSKPQDPTTALGVLSKSIDSFTNKLASKSSALGHFTNMTNPGMTKGGMAASAALGAGSLLMSGLDKVKETFVDPFINAAKGGFQNGFNRGSGLETFAKTFEYVGLVVGLKFAPAIITAATWVMTFADRLRASSKSVESFGTKYMDTVDKVVTWGGYNPAKKVLDSFGIGDWRKNMKAFQNKEDPEFQKMLKKLTTSFENSLTGQKAGYTDIASVREAAQMANFVDPLEKMMQQAIVDELPRIRQTSERTAGTLEQGSKR